MADLIKKYAIEIIAIGNGTASRESEAFVAEVLKDFPETSYVIVNESGASVYSASELARHEFPDLTVEKRSAISIARRLQDPLAELVKIDPKSIGVGQYQHDVSQKKLSENLDFVVDTVVNQVGVNVNTASSTLLSHVSGLNKTISENIVAYREENGEIASRAEIKRSHDLVPRPLNKPQVSFVFQMPRISWIIQGPPRVLPSGKRPLQAVGYHRFGRLCQREIEGS